MFGKIIKNTLSSDRFFTRREHSYKLMFHHSLMLSLELSSFTEDKNKGLIPKAELGIWFLVTFTRIMNWSSSRMKRMLMIYVYESNNNNLFHWIEIFTLIHQRTEPFCHGGTHAGKNGGWSTALATTTMPAYSN